MIRIKKSDQLRKQSFTYTERGPAGLKDLPDLCDHDLTLSSEIIKGCDFLVCFPSSGQ